jgi:hypothetical protein
MGVNDQLHTFWANSLQYTMYKNLRTRGPELVRSLCEKTLKPLATSEARFPSSPVHSLETA